jgi:molecular chaperone GrpE
MTTRKREIPIDADTAAEEPVPAGVAEAFSPTAPADDLDALIKERDQLADALLRLRAEFDNYRRRSVRELTDARTCAQGDVLAELLPVLDNLERALDAAEHHEEGKVLQGVRMTRDLFVGLLTRAGVEEVPGVGTPFDPQVHDAILTQPSEEEEGVVTAVLERGYRQGEQVLRPARVAVSAGRCDMPASD